MKPLTRLLRRPRIRGIALPVVLVIASMMLVTSSAWFEAALFEARNARLIADDLLAFHAADAALMLCTRALASGAMLAPAAPAQAGEPDGWRQQATFDTRAVAAIGQWPGSVRPPQCLIESWRLDSRPAARAFVVTARGFGASESTQRWLQIQLVLDETEARVERHWRRIAARPF
ncbi:pilus assembly PilX family protein [Paraburkholderia ferrariae]|uniref:pilus assembly PilX family protein n=1 Tax=Paraburkholderia ferrariae TaxID=386056 RepID=UPI0005A8E124|nr:pilus assembly protein [Paraburkholderia ferrariae]